MTSNKTIFICYRRDDAEGYAGRIYDRLHARFPGRVFMDVTGINPGADFSRVIQDTVGTCGVLLAIIGKQWLTIKDEGDTPRIQKSDDYVRHEIATAFYRNVPVIPVLVREAKMPGETTLPPDLASLSKRNALEISDDDFEHDALRLIAAIEYLFKEPKPPVPLPQPQKSNRTCLIVAIVGIVLGGGGLLVVVLLGALAANQNTNGGGDRPYPAPTATATQPPKLYEEPAASTSQFPVGSWALTLFSTADGHQEQHAVVIFPNGTYLSNGYTRRWGYQQSTLTLESWGTIVIQRQTADGYVGVANLNGYEYTIAMTPAAAD